MVRGLIVSACVVGLMGATGCRQSAEPEKPGGSAAASDAQDAVPVFSLAWSEYPSWSVFGVAHEIGIINGKEGEMGPIE